MTCIAGVKHEGKVYLGGDGRTTDGDEIHPSEPKVMVYDTYALGCAGDGRVCQLIAHAFVPPKPPAREDEFGFLITTFATDLSKALREYGIDIQDPKCKQDFVLMVGLHGRLFVVDSSLCVVEYDHYVAVGSGATWADGHLAATSKLSPKLRIQRALVHAAAKCASVGPPYTFVSV